MHANKPLEEMWRGKNDSNDHELMDGWMDRSSDLRIHCERVSQEVRDERKKSSRESRDDVHDRLDHEFPIL